MKRSRHPAAFIRFGSGIDYQLVGGYGGDMPEDQAYDLLDDIDFYYNKVKCRKIEKLLPVLTKLVKEEQKLL